MHCYLYHCFFLALIKSLFFQSLKWKKKLWYVICLHVFQRQRLLKAAKFCSWYFQEKAYYPSLVGFPFAYSSSCSSLNPPLWGPYSPPAQHQCCTTFNKAEISPNNWKDHTVQFISYTPDIILKCMWGDDQTVMFGLCIMSKR